MDTVWAVLEWVVPISMIWVTLDFVISSVLYVKARKRVAVPTGDHVPEYATRLRNLKSSAFYFVGGVAIWWLAVRWDYMEFPPPWLPF